MPVELWFWTIPYTVLRAGWINNALSVLPEANESFCIGQVENTDWFGVHPEIPEYPPLPVFSHPGYPFDFSSYILAFPRLHQQSGRTGPWLLWIPLPTARSWAGRARAPVSLYSVLWFPLQGPLCLILSQLGKKGIFESLAIEEIQ